MAIYYALVRGGVGRVRAVPGLRDPLVGYRLDPAGFADLATGLRDLVRLLLHAGAETVFPGVPGSAPVSDEAALDAMPPTLAGSGAPLLSLHLAASCPMGERERLSAADSFGRVAGTDDLRIADASMLCDAPGVNPQGTIMAFARRNVLEALGKS
jgi:choline dehydrogenase-like flavoprotein